MDIFAGLCDKLSFIERLYVQASAPFTQTKAQIEAGQPPFAPPPFDPDSWNGEPPFLDDWLEADEGLNLLGQLCLSLVQGAFKGFLDDYIGLSGRLPPGGKGNWFKRYKRFFADSYGIDWDSAPVLPAYIEEINLARNDIQHSETTFGMARYQSDEHHRRFPRGIFTSPISHEMPSLVGRIQVTAGALREAIGRVQAFRAFLDEKKPFR